MGAIDFFVTATGSDLSAAFSAAREEAAREYGSGAYSGSVAAKDEVVLLDEPRRSEGDAMARADELLIGDHPQIGSTWGPAGALPIVANGSGEDGWLIFGLAAY
ncbi:hypothetical protein AB0B50_40205 [Streptomyces sp. NPDC041068]|uniref:hypothetical protein n=1 Tax=Streptomyces sp. NPDC041068 TaxID=3155130 RepID=UPI0033CB2F86